MAPKNLQSHLVWDAPTRIFHWVNVICFIALAVIGTAILYNKLLGVSNPGKILLKTIHVWFGYVFVINLGFRLVWAFFGNNYARWSAILPFYQGFWRDFINYLRAFASGNGRPYLGHNPVAKAMIFLLLALLVAQAITGLVLAGTDIYYPPFGQWITSWIAATGVDPATLVPNDKKGIDEGAWHEMRSARKPFIIVHYWGFFALLFAVFVHIAGVVVTELREGSSLISAMITGKKTLDQDPQDSRDQ